MRRLITGFLVVAGFVWSATAAAEAGPQEDQLFVSVLGGYYGEPDDVDLRDGDTNIGAAIGYGITDKWLFEIMYFDFDPEAEVNGVRGDADLGYLSANILRKIGEPENWQPYFVFGGGRMNYSYGDLRSDERDEAYHVGLGFFSNLTERLAFRADVRGLYHNEPKNFSPMATVGLTLMLGDKPEPAAPAAAPPPEPRDSDGDGVVDDRDDCPNTPSGVQVDSRGCPLDGDGDGVPDHRDDCPGTPAGARVDDRGCEIKVAQPVSFNLTVQFATNSAEITGVAFQEMLELLRFLREHPSTDAVIEGHTDNTGAEDYNQGLSERRAQAVVDALTNSGISRDRLTARGFGESRPIASNDTAEGRQQNRRVTVVVSGTDG